MRPQQSTSSWRGYGDGDDDDWVGDDDDGDDDWVGAGTICALSAAAAARHKTGATALPHMGIGMSLRGDDDDGE